jgi:hypothetical protein
MRYNMNCRSKNTYNAGGWTRHECATQGRTSVVRTHQDCVTELTERGGLMIGR